MIMRAIGCVLALARMGRSRCVVVFRKQVVSALDLQPKSSEMTKSRRGYTEVPRGTDNNRADGYEQVST